MPTLLTRSQWAIPCLPTFEQRYQELSALLDTFSGEEWHSPCWHPRRGTMTAREYVSQRIQELAVHDWDMRSAFDPNAGLYPDAEPVAAGHGTPLAAHGLQPVARTAGRNRPLPFRPV